MRGSQCVATLENVPMRMRPERRSVNSSTFAQKLSHCAQSSRACGSSAIPSFVRWMPARVSFAPEKMQELLGMKIGAAAVSSGLLESAKDVRFVLDRDVLREEF